MHLTVFVVGSTSSPTESFPLTDVMGEVETEGISVVVSVRVEYVMFNKLSNCLAFCSCCRCGC